MRPASEEYQPLLRRLLARGMETSAVEYSGALERRLQFITDMQVLAESADVLLTPTTPTPALADLTNTGNTQFQGPWTLLRPAHHHHTVRAGGVPPAHGSANHRRAPSARSVCWPPPGGASVCLDVQLSPAGQLRRNDAETQRVMEINLK